MFKDEYRFRTVRTGELAVPNSSLICIMMQLAAQRFHNFAFSINNLSKFNKKDPP